MVLGFKVFGKGTLVYAIKSVRLENIQLRVQSIVQFHVNKLRSQLHAFSIRKVPSSVVTRLQFELYSQFKKVNEQ